MTSEFIHRRKFSADLGITDGVFDGWKKRHWNEGKHYIIIGRQILVNLREVNQWLEKETIEDLLPESIKETTESTSNGAGAKRNTSINRTRRPMPGTLSQR